MKNNFSRPHAVKLGRVEVAEAEVARLERLGQECADQESGGEAWRVVYRVGEGERERHDVQEVQVQDEQYSVRRQLDGAMSSMVPSSSSV